jgi:hypothetical protein
MHWSPANAKLGFFKAVFWFPRDVVNYDGIFAIAPAFLLKWADFQKLLAVSFYHSEFKQALLLSQLCVLFLRLFLSNNGTKERGWYHQRFAFYGYQFKHCVLVLDELEQTIC